MAQNPHRFHTIVDANGWDVLLNKSALAVALDQCALPNRGWAWTRWNQCDILWFTLPEFFLDTTRVFPKIGVPQNGWFIMENPIKMHDLGEPLFLETPTQWWLFCWNVSISCSPWHPNLVTWLWPARLCRSCYVKWKPCQQVPKKNA